jgi:hypothetical protein
MHNSKLQERVGNSSPFQEPIAFLAILLLRIGNIAILTLAMSHASQTGHSLRKDERPSSERATGDTSSQPCDLSGRKEPKRILAQGSAQTIGKSRFSEGNPRKTKPSSLIVFGLAWPDLAEFG